MTSLNITTPTSDLLLVREPADTSCAARGYDVAYLELDEHGTVSITTEYHVGGDATPMSVWEGRTKRWQIASAQGGHVLLSADAITAALADGAELRALVDLVAAGHTVDYDRNSNRVGSLNEAATEADAAIYHYLHASSLTADVEVWDAELWAYGQGNDQDCLSNFGLTSGSTDADIAAAATEGKAIAKRDGIILVGDLATALTQARNNVRLNSLSVCL